jgi:hypothetical protein
MLTPKQNEIIEQIKQEFESHNDSINSRKKSSSLLNLETIISDIQERENLIEEQFAINLANYRAVYEKVQEEIEVLNRELKVLGFYACLLRNRYDSKGEVDKWGIDLITINPQNDGQKRFMSMYVQLKRNHVYFRGKRIDNLHEILPQYTWHYSNYRADNVISLMKNDYLKEHLGYYWERFNKK